jgi:hypothetical protein
MSITAPWLTTKWCSLAEALASSECLPGAEHDIYGFDRLALLNDGALHCRTLGAQERQELERRVALADQESAACAEHQARFLEMWSTVELDVVGRPGNPLAEPRSIDPDARRYLDPFAEGSRSIAKGPDGVRIYDVRVRLRLDAPGVVPIGESPAATVAPPPVPAAGGAKAPAPKRRGPKAKKFARVKAEMQADIAEKRLSSEDLDGMPEKQLKDRYHASRTTCREVRKSVLAELSNDK